MTDDGFGTVGDMGSLDTDGYLYLVDRRVDLIITGGANVFPAEVEAALIDHPKIADVVVVGLKDPEWGRRVHAIIEPTDPRRPADLRRDQGLHQESPAALQSAQDHRTRRRHPPQRSDEGQPRTPRRNPRRLT